MTDSTAPTTATVPVKSAWYSKINWTQAVATGAMVITLVTGGKLSISGDQQAAIVTTIGVIGGIVTFVCRTWFNGSVSPSSLPAK